MLAHEVQNFLSELTKFRLVVVLDIGRRMPKVYHQGPLCIQKYGRVALLTIELQRTPTGERRVRRQTPTPFCQESDKQIVYESDNYRSRLSLATKARTR